MCILVVVTRVLFGKNFAPGLSGLRKILELRCQERHHLELPFNYRDSEWGKALFDDWWVSWPTQCFFTSLSLLVAAMVPASATPAKSRLETVSQQEVHEAQLPTALLPPAHVLMCAAASVAVPKRVRLVASIYRITSRTLMISTN